MLVSYWFYLLLCFEEQSKKANRVRRAELPDLYIGQCKTKTEDCNNIIITLIIITIIIIIIILIIQTRVKCRLQTVGSFN